MRIRKRFIVFTTLAAILSVILTFCISYHVQKQELQKEIDEKRAKLIRLQKQSIQFQEELHLLKKQETTWEWPLIASGAPNPALQPTTKRAYGASGRG